LHSGSQAHTPLTFQLLGPLRVQFRNGRADAIQPVFVQFRANVAPMPVVNCSEMFQFLTHFDISYIVRDHQVN